MTLIKIILYLVLIFLDESISILLVFPEFIFTKTHMQKTAKPESDPMCLLEDKNFIAWFSVLPLPTFHIHAYTLLTNYHLSLNCRICLI